MADSRLEDNKLIFDFLKHLTTLATGSIVIVATLSSNLLPVVQHGWGIIVSLFWFLASIYGSVFAMWRLTFQIGMGESAAKAKLGTFGQISFAIAVIGFFFGIAALAGTVCPLWGVAAKP